MPSQSSQTEEEYNYYLSRSAPRSPLMQDKGLTVIYVMLQLIGRGGYFGECGCSWIRSSIESSIKLGM